MVFPWYPMAFPWIPTESMPSIQEINVERQRRREEAEREAIADAVKKKERWNSGDATYDDEIAGLWFGT